MITIAEGIEEQEQAELLTEMGCNIGQGYLFYHPMKAKDFAKIPWKQLNC